MTEERHSRLRLAIPAAARAASKAERVVPPDPRPRLMTMSMA